VSFELVEGERVFDEWQRLIRFHFPWSLLVFLDVGAFCAKKCIRQGNPTQIKDFRSVNQGTIKILAFMEKMLKNSKTKLALSLCSCPITLLRLSCWFCTGRGGVNSFV
jgi:hypothetical protein